MAPPKDAFLIHGGCNCRALRYEVHVPAWEQRAPTPYRTPGAKIDSDPRLPFTVVDHCNDCRRATGALLPVGLVTEMAWTRTTCITKAGTSVELPAAELFDYETIADRAVHLACYKSSPQRSRWFCTRCGTSLAYTIDAGAIPAEWGWPTILNLWVGTLDRADLEHDWMAPERMLWCEKAIPWVQSLARRGAQVPEHPTNKIDEVVDTSRSIDEVVADARSHLRRVTPEQAHQEMLAQKIPTVLVDIRPIAQRQAHGMVESALVIERNVLEWRLDPRCDARIPHASKDLRVIVFCQEGYTTPLAANSLLDLGLVNATDMVGGFAAWKQAGLPLAPH